MSFCDKLFVTIRNSTLHVMRPRSIYRNFTCFDLFQELLSSVKKCASHTYWSKMSSLDCLSQKFSTDCALGKTPTNARVKWHKMICRLVSTRPHLFRAHSSLHPQITVSHDYNYLLDQRMAFVLQLVSQSDSRVKPVIISSSIQSTLIENLVIWLEVVARSV